MLSYRLHPARASDIHYLQHFVVQCVRQPLVDKVDTKCVQNQAAKHEIRKRPLAVDLTHATIFHNLARRGVNSLHRCSGPDLCG